MRCFSFCLALVALGLFIVAGCDNPAGNNKTNNKAASGEKHDHDHDHDHAAHEHAAHGPNDGHVFKLSPADLSAEWTHSSANDIIKVFVLDKDSKTNQAVKCDKVVITPMSGNDTTPFELPAVAPNPNGETAEFMLDSKQLNVAMTLGVKVEVKVGDKTYTGEIPPHAPHDH
jgi:hypothetical protein